MSFPQTNDPEVNKAFNKQYENEIKDAGYILDNDFNIIGDTKAGERGDIQIDKEFFDSEFYGFTPTVSPPYVTETLWNQTVQLLPTERLVSVNDKLSLVDNTDYDYLDNFIGLIVQAKDIEQDDNAFVKLAKNIYNVFLQIIMKLGALGGIAINVIGVPVANILYRLSNIQRGVYDFKADFSQIGKKIANVFSKEDEETSKVFSITQTGKTFVFPEGVRRFLQGAGEFLTLNLEGAFMLGLLIFIGLAIAIIFGVSRLQVLTGGRVNLDLLRRIL